MASADLSCRVTAAALGATTLTRPSSFDVNEDITWYYSQAGGLITHSTKAITMYTVRASVTFEKPISPPAKGRVSGTNLTITVNGDISGSFTVTCSDMVCDSVSMSGSNGSPFTQKIDFDYAGTAVDGTAISVA